jgi:hypothetical protein
MPLQGKVGWRSGAGAASSLWNSIYSVYNADSVGSSSLKTSLYSVYNGESNANDSFGSNNGTAQGGLTYTTGKIGQAFNLNGTNSYVQLPNNMLSFTTFSYSTWVYLKSVPSVPSTLISSFNGNGTTVAYGMIYHVENGGRLKLNVYNNALGSSWTTSTTLAANQWYHLVVTKVASEAPKFYINGVLNTTNLISGTNTLNPVYSGGSVANSLCTIGANRFNNDGTKSWYSNSNIDATTIWNKELTASEVTDLYNAGNGAQYIGDNFYKPTPNDSLGTNNGTAQGGLTYAPGKIGTAFQFNGTNAYVSLPANSLKFTNSTFSTSMWMYIPSNVSVDQILIGCLRFPSGWRGWGISMYQNTIYFYIGTASGKLDVTYGNNSLIGQWAHLVATHENGVGGKLYVNGVLRTTVANVNPIVYDSVETPSIGCAFVAGGAQPTWFMKNGSKLDAIGVWNRVLTATEVTELYNSGNGKQYPN